MDDYIDLGLPSGKLWKKAPEKGYFTFTEAVKKFGSSLPTREDFVELIKNTSHSWDKDRLGMIFTGKNGNSIFLPAAGLRFRSSVNKMCDWGRYWSATAYSESLACHLLFTDCGISLTSCCGRRVSQSVILTKEKEDDRLY